MKNRTLIYAALIALSLVAPRLSAQERDRRDRDRGRDSQSQSQSSQQLAPAPQGYLEKYAVVEQRNVFVKDRSRPTSRPSFSSTTQPTRRSAEESLVVRGIAIEDDGIRAYVEDLNANNTLRVSPGDSLARGHIVEVALDAIAYEHDGKVTWIDIEHDLTGKRVAPPPLYGSSSGSTATTGPTTLPANVNLDDPSLTTIERMRLRSQLLNQRR